MLPKFPFSTKLGTAIILVSALPYFASIVLSIYIHNRTLSFALRSAGALEYQEFSRLTANYYFTLIALWVIAVIGGAIVAAYFYRRFVQPIETLSEIALDIARGKNREIPHQKTQSEISVLYDYIRIVKESLTKEIGRLQNINKLKTEFISIAAHQLRTPLSSIKWLIEVMLENNNNLNNAYRGKLEDIYKSNERLITLVNDLLSAAKLEGGEIIAKKQLVDIEKSIQYEIDANKVEASRRNIKINFKKMTELHELEIDPLLFSQALKNLLENAVFYSIPDSEIDVTVTMEQGSYIIAVHNEGAGIAEMEHDKLFTKFYRGPVAQRLRPEGSGLGLFIAKMAVEANGGSIWFESPTHDGGGVTFYISVPISK